MGSSHDPVSPPHGSQTLPCILIGSFSGVSRFLSPYISQPSSNRRPLTVLIGRGSVSRTVSCFFPISKGYFSFTYLPATVVLQVCPGSIGVWCFRIYDLRLIFPRSKGSRKFFMPYPQQHLIPFSDSALLKEVLSGLLSFLQYF